jgi:PAS domain-containing protein
MVFCRERVLFHLVARREFRIREKPKALLDSEEKYRMLLQHANDAIVIADAETGTVLEVNEKSSN